MASPWKFLSRLVSPRRGQKQDNGTVDDAKPDVLAIAGPTGTLAEKSLNYADRPASTETPHRDPSDTASAEPAPADEAESEAYDRVGTVGADVAAVGGSASSDDTHIAVTTAHDAGETESVAEGAAPKQRSRGKNNNPAVVIAKVAPGVHAASNDTMSLDEEIRALRGQLAIKLQVQNAQLKKMLERFER